MAQSAFWDRMRWPSTPTTGIQLVQVGETVTEAHERLRTKVFEDAAVGVADDVKARSSEWLPEELKRELTRRTTYWRGNQAEPGTEIFVLRWLLGVVNFAVIGAPTSDQKRQFAGRYSLVKVLVAVVLVSAASYFGAGHMWVIAILAVVLAVVAMIAESRVFVARSIRQIDAALGALECGDCGYELISKVALDNVAESCPVGPPRCPECGAPWPLVPPPVPEWPQFK